MLTREQFLLGEIRSIATLRFEGLTDSAILYLVENDNIFQYATSSQTRRIAQCCFRRLDSLEGLCSGRLALLLANGLGTHAQAAQINLYAMSRCYGLMRRFLLEEVAERYRTLDLSITRMDLNAFFSRLAERDASAARWTESTVKKLKTVLRSSLAQAGILQNARSETMQPIVIDPTLERAMREAGDQALLPAFNCFSKNPLPSAQTSDMEEVFA